MNSKNKCIVLAGSRDFLRRVQGYFSENSNYNFLTCNPVDMSSTIAAEKPNALVLEVGIKINKQELKFIKESLKKIKESQRKEKGMKVILAATSSKKIAYLGELLFESDNSLSPSQLIDDFVIAPPPASTSVLNLEQQIENALLFLDNDLPALWNKNWVPSLCSPLSRETWKKWVPRYAKYTNESPLIIGATGTGKTRMAVACHHLSQVKGSFVTMTPRDFSSSELVQAELFGSVAGAFTGSVDKWGLVKKAENGSLFIDELQSIDLDLQGKLITFIENKKYRRVGDSENHQANVRFIFACNQPLEKLVSEKKLREDFAYRLERLQIPLLPLSERKLDILSGAAFSISKVLRERNLIETQDESEKLLPIEGFSIDSYRKLFSTEWSGNLRQLENAIAKSIELCLGSDKKNIIEQEILEKTLEELLVGKTKDTSTILHTAMQRLINSQEKITNLADVQNQIARHARATALESTGGDTKQAASLIGDSKEAIELFVSKNGSFDRKLKDSELKDE